MALIKSTILSAIRGSINGTTFAVNKSGAYARNRTVPINPNSDNQQAARSGMATTSQGWVLISQTQRSMWNAYAASTPTVNRLGDVVHLSGFNWYCAINSYLLFIGEPTVQEPPLTPGVAAAPTMDTIVLTDQASGDQSSLTVTAYTGGDTGADSRYAFWISRPVSQGVTFYKGPWNYVGPLSGTNRTSLQPTGQIINVDQRYFIRLRYYDQNGKLANQITTGPITPVNVP